MIRRLARPILLLVLPVTLVAACSGGGGDEEDAATTTAVAAEAATTTSEPATTTTESPEEQALDDLGEFTSEEEAQFRLFSNPPQVPGPLAALTAPVEPFGAPLPIVRANPDGSPVVNEFGDYVFVGARFDALGRLLAADDGRLLDDQGGEIPRDGEGPILLAVKFGPDGQPERAEPAEGQPPEEAPVLFERRLVEPANRVLVVGDSVILGTQGTLPNALVGWKTLLDARESRLPGEGDNVIRGHTDIGRVVIVMLGHNVGPGEDHISNIRGIQQALDERPFVDRVVWVTAAEIGPAQLEWNEALRTYVAERQEGGDVEAHILDWALYNAANAGYSDDGLHLTGDGRTELADLLAQFVGPAPDCDLVIGGGPSAGQCV